MKCAGQGKKTQAKGTHEESRKAMRTPIPAMSELPNRIDPSTGKPQKIVSELKAEAIISPLEAWWERSLYNSKEQAHAQEHSPTHSFTHFISQPCSKTFWLSTWLAILGKNVNIREGHTSCCSAASRGAW